MDLRHLAFAIGAFCVIHSLRNNYFRDIKVYISSLDPKPYLKILVFAVCSFAFGLILDVTVHPFLMETRNSWQGIAKAGEAISQNTEFWFACFLVYFLAVLFKSKKLWHMMEGVLLTTGLAGLTGHLLKFVFMRARPYYEAGPFSFFNLDGLLKHSHRFQSLPSGDVTILSGFACFMMVSVKNKFLKVIFAVIPVLVASSRVHENKHWISDGIAAFFIALAFAVLIHNYHVVRFESESVKKST